MKNIETVFRYAREYAAEQMTDTEALMKEKIHLGVKELAELAALRERVEKLEAENKKLKVVRNKAETVIEEWQIFGNVSDFDMKTLRTELTKALQEAQ